MSRKTNTKTSTKTNTKTSTSTSTSTIDERIAAASLRSAAARGCAAGVSRSRRRPDVDHGSI
jgi:hypothetical protein